MLSEILNEILAMFLEMAPYILLGLIFVGLLNLYVSKEIITRQVGGNNFWSVLKAALFGIPLPLCSCGVVPTAVYMSKSGASKGATVSFLISTPQTGIDSIIATYGMLGPVFAVFRPFAALVMGITGGIAVRYADKKKEEPKPKFIGINQFTTVRNDASAVKPPFSKRLKQTIDYSFVEFLDDIAVQFIAGVIIAGLIAYFIPDDFFADSGLSSGIAGMLLMIAVGIPMYVCATASIPIAMSLMMKGFSPGVAFVFLAAGPATNAASLTIISHSLGKKVTAVYLASIIILSMAMGYLLDFIFNVTSGGSAMNHEMHNHGDMPLSPELKIVIGIIFAVMLAGSLYRKYVKRYLAKSRDTLAQDVRKVSIEGMTCNHCVANVSKTIGSIKGVESVDVRLDEHAAYIRGSFDMKLLEKEISGIGYKVV